VLSSHFVLSLLSLSLSVALRCANRFAAKAAGMEEGGCWVAGTLVPDAEATSATDSPNKPGDAVGLLVLLVPKRLPPLALVGALAAVAAVAMSLPGSG